MESETERLLRRIIRSELQQLNPQATPRPVDDGEAMEKVLEHLSTCTDPACTINAHLENFFEKNYKGCPECGGIVKKKAKVCKHCSEEIEESDESW